MIYEILGQESCVPSKTSNRLFLRIPTLHSFSPTHPQLNTRSRRAFPRGSPSTTRSPPEWRSTRDGDQLTFDELLDNADLEMPCNFCSASGGKLKHLRDVAVARQLAAPSREHPQLDSRLPSLRTQPRATRCPANNDLAKIAVVLSLEMYRRIGMDSRRVLLPGKQPLGSEFPRRVGRCRCCQHGRPATNQSGSPSAPWVLGQSHRICQ